jgi:hypothetical protein
MAGRRRGGARRRGWEGDKAEPRQDRTEREPKSQLRETSRDRTSNLPLLPRTQRQAKIAWGEVIDRRLRNGKTILEILAGFTEGVIICEALGGAVKLAREIINMLQVVCLR